MEYIGPELFNQVRLKTKLSNQQLISKLSDEDLNHMMLKHEEKDERYQKFINETTERNTEILNQIYYEQDRRKKRIS